MISPGAEDVLAGMLIMYTLSRNVVQTRLLNQKICSLNGIMDGNGHYLTVCPKTALEAANQLAAKKKNDGPIPCQSPTPWSGLVG